MFLEEAKGSFRYVSTVHLTLVDLLNSRHFATGDVIHSASRKIDRQKSPDLFAKW